MSLLNIETQKAMDKELFKSSVIRFSQTKITAFNETLVSTWHSRGKLNKMYFDLFLSKTLSDKIANGEYTIILYLFDIKYNEYYKLYEVNHGNKRYKMKQLSNVNFYRMITPVPDVSGIYHKQFKLVLELNHNKHNICTISRTKLELYTRGIPEDRNIELSFYDLLYKGMKGIKGEPSKEHPRSFITDIIKRKHYSFHDLSKNEQISKYFLFLSYMRDKRKFEYSQLKITFHKDKFNEFCGDYDRYKSKYTFSRNPWYILIYLKNKYQDQFIFAFGESFSFDGTELFPIVKRLLHAIDSSDSHCIKEYFENHNTLSYIKLIEIVSYEIGFLYSFCPSDNFTITRLTLFFSDIIETEMNDS